jgi:hypothetical protein
LKLRNKSRRIASTRIFETPN